MNIRYKPQCADTDIIIRRGMVGRIESNLVNCYMGEWIVFEFPGEDGKVGAEVRLPLEYAVEHRLIVPENKFEEDNEIER